MRYIYIDDIRKTGHCTAGARRWFERHGLNFRSFLDHGIAEEELLKTNDALALSVIARKLERENGQADRK